MLNFAEFTLFVHLFDEEVFAAVNDGFRHHVLQAGLLDHFHDLTTLVNRRCHRHRTHDVFASIKCLQGHPRVVVDRAVDVNEVDVFVGQHFVVGRVTLVDPKLIATLLQFRRIASADRRNVGIRMSLVDRNELGPKAEPDHRHIELLCHRLLLK